MDHLIGSLYVFPENVEFDGEDHDAEIVKYDGLTFLFKIT
jgi:hypothetical protein